MLDLALRTVAVLGFLVFTVLFLIWLERKVLGRIQMRMGPMRTAPFGVLQSVADALKLVLKEGLRPDGADRWVYHLGPVVAVLPALMVWVTIPLAGGLVVQDMRLGVFYIVAISGVSVVGMVMAGWSSNNKYALLGAARTAAQMISYELPLVLALLGVVMLAQSLSLGDIVEQQSPWPYLLLQPLSFALFLIAGLAELARNPFDIYHADTEIVGGPFVEYSGIRWAMFFMAEYVNLFAISALAALLFLGGWKGPLLPDVVWLLTKTYAFVLFIIWLRATLPRLRIDQLMALAWRYLVPLAFANILVIAFYLYYQMPGWTLSLASLAMAGIALVPLYRHWSGRAPARTRTADRGGLPKVESRA
ncbi:MAG: NADH-quinone oxidoreductase subunit NuoH [Chloroflexi bacterium]|nr:NADH-quinone oxidoreductase subunit NuoH [Chloroflexota bacterium]